MQSVNLFAAGYRKYVDPADNQIGVHSIYQLIRQEGAQTFLKGGGHPSPPPWSFDLPDR
jgi:hypothetical protein